MFSFPLFSLCTVARRNGAIRRAEAAKRAAPCGRRDHPARFESAVATARATGAYRRMRRVATIQQHNKRRNGPSVAARTDLRRRAAAVAPVAVSVRSSGSRGGGSRGPGHSDHGGAADDQFHRRSRAAAPVRQELSVWQCYSNQAKRRFGGCTQLARSPRTAHASQSNAHCKRPATSRISSKCASITGKLVLPALKTLKVPFSHSHATELHPNTARTHVKAPQTRVLLSCSTPAVA